MSTPAVPEFEAESDSCVVCGKSTSGARGYMQLRVGERLIHLCCPMCVKLYQERVALAKADTRNSAERELGWTEKW